MSTASSLWNNAWEGIENYLVVHARPACPHEGAALPMVLTATNATELSVRFACLSCSKQVQARVNFQSQTIVWTEVSTKGPKGAR